MLREIYVKNFRSLLDFRMNFNKDTTMIVGENDSGKTSIIDAIKIILKPEETQFNIEDFSYGETKALIKIKIDNKYYIKEFRINETSVDEINSIGVDKEVIENTKNYINGIDFSHLDEENQRIKLFEIMFELGIPRGNAKLIDTLKVKVNEAIKDLEENDYISEITQIPGGTNIFFLDGKRFKNIDEHINELYFDKIKKEIWNERAIGSNTIENIIDYHLQRFTSELEKKIEEQGSIEKLREYVPNITKIKITPNFTRRLNVDLKVDLIEGENVVPVENKGDGTKRRITMALLEIKNEIDQEYLDTYIFDEPDTHLHVKSELDLLKILRNFVENQKQVIITTHSPFLLNSVNPEKVKLLQLINNQTVLSAFNSEDFESVLNTLGISNTNLFFSKKLLIVEGYTEYYFIPRIFKKIYGFDLKNVLVKIINGKGIDRSSSAARVFRDFEFVKKDDIYIMIDNDGDNRLKRFVELIDIPKKNKQEIGFKEFEDTFCPSLIYHSWKKHVTIELKTENPEAFEKFEKNWSLEMVIAIKNYCLKNNQKFSTKLSEYSGEICLYPMDKPELGIALAECAEKNDLDPKILYIFDKIKEG